LKFKNLTVFWNSVISSYLDNPIFRKLLLDFFLWFTFFLFLQLNVFVLKHILSDLKILNKLFKNCRRWLGRDFADSMPLQLGKILIWILKNFQDLHQTIIIGTDLLHFLLLIPFLLCNLCYNLFQLLQSNLKHYIRKLRKNKNFTFFVEFLEIRSIMRFMSSMKFVWTIFMQEHIKSWKESSVSRTIMIPMRVIVVISNTTESFMMGWMETSL